MNERKNKRDTVIQHAKIKQGDNSRNKMWKRIMKKMISNFDKVDIRIKVFQLDKFILIYSYNFLFIRFRVFNYSFSLYLQLDILFGIKYIWILQFFT